MNFLTFLLYFCISHLVYTVVVSALATAYQLHRQKKQNNALQQLLKSGQVTVVQMDDPGDEGWH